MVLVDTSVWVDHLRFGNARLASLLEDGEVACHPFILGELACGNLPDRAETLARLHDLPRSGIAEHGEIMELIEVRRLMGRGLGLIDVHLLAAALIEGVPLWTLDRPLKKAAAQLGIEFV